jgi:hypothetical protein
VEVQPGIMAASLGTEEVVLNRNLNSLWHTIMVDPADPTYTPALGQSFGIGRVVSFGEDNAGNLYIVDMGGTRGNAGFGNDYPSGTTGEIFRLTPLAPSLKLRIDRSTGTMTIINETDGAFALKGYTIASTVGAVNSAAFTPITGNFDAPPAGDGSIDSNDAWQITSPIGSKVAFTEASTGDAGALGADAELALGAANGWTRSFMQDMTFSFTRGDGSTGLGVVEYVGNAIARSDFDANGTIDLDDWRTFIASHRTNLAGLTGLEQYLRGDVDRDGDNDIEDFVAFKTDYESAHGVGSLAKALAEIPEPGTLALALTALIGAFGRRRGTRFAGHGRHAN